MVKWAYLLWMALGSLSIFGLLRGLRRPMMSRVWDRLYVGDAGSVQAVGEIEAVLNVAAELDDALPPGVEYLKVPLVDGQPVGGGIAPAMWWIRDKIRYRRVLVHCNAGVSRGPAIVLCYLIECGMGFGEALEFLAYRHPATAIHPVVLESVKGYYRPYIPVGKRVWLSRDGEG